jgi:flagellar biosynthesis/type III secretory pathway M-ring protein FliF/YscJ
MPSSLTIDAAAEQGGFSWVNLGVLVLVILVLWPLYRKLRDSISRSRRERWAREEQENRHLTEETDPDLRR